MQLKMNTEQTGMHSASRYTLDGIKNSFSIHVALLNYHPNIGDVIKSLAKTQGGDSSLEAYPPLFWYLNKNTERLGELFIYDFTTSSRLPLFGSYKDDKGFRKCGCCGGGIYEHSIKQFEYLQVLDLFTHGIRILNKNNIHSTLEYISSHPDSIFNYEKEVSISTVTYNGNAMMVNDDEIDVVLEVEYKIDEIIDKLIPSSRFRSAYKDTLLKSFFKMCDRMETDGNI